MSVSAKAIEREIMSKMMASEEVHHKLDAVVKEAQRKAKELAPVFGDLPPRRESPPNGGSPGDYRDSIVIENVKGKPHVRRLISRDYKAIWIEIGTRHMPEYAVFTKIASMYHAKTGPHFTNDGGGRVSMHDENVKRKHELLRGALDDLKGLIGADAESAAIERARDKINTIRNQRSAAFRAAAPRRRRRR